LTGGRATPGEVALPHETPLISTIVAGLGLAFLLGLLAQRFKLPPIAGYLLAGVAIGPFTPGFVADQKLATELAEIGVILLMFGVGLHFSLRDLLSVRAIAVPGAIGQIATATLLGMGLAWLMGWGVGAGIVFGLALSVASTVVLLRALQERRLIETERGRIAVGWLIVEDLVMVLTLVLLPPLAGLLGGRSDTPPADLGLVAWLGVGTIPATLILTAIKIIAFVGVMLLVGRKLIPWILHYVAYTGSRELFRLSVLAIALGVAFGSAELFGVSFALGAFFAGMVLAESPLSHQAARETLPLRDAFAVLFFVSVGMLFNPAILLDSPLAVIATILIVIVGKSAAAYGIVRLFRHPRPVALTISASLAQIGEFSFILVVLGTSLGVLSPEARDLVVAGAIVSILVNPFLFRALDRMQGREPPVREPIRAEPPPAATSPAPASPEPVAATGPDPVTATERDEEPTTLSGHAILVGHGRVGSRVAASLKAQGLPFLVVEENEDLVESLRSDGIETFTGPAGEAALIERLNLPGARTLILAIPAGFEAGHLIEEARRHNPSIRILARAQGEKEAEQLRSFGADLVLTGEEEIARAMIAGLAAPGGIRAPAPTS
jgi:CPA2 family monovalent cation:H+ antiporter-2